MAKFSLVDLISIPRDPDPTLMDIINSAPAGQAPLLDEASLRRYKAALNAAGETELAANPDRNRLRSSDPTLDAILAKQERLTQIDNQLLEGAVKAFTQAQQEVGSDIALGAVEGLTMALAIDPNNATLRQRLNDANKQLDAANKRLPNIQDQIIRKNNIKLLQEKKRVEGELLQLETLRKAGQTIEGVQLGLADSMAKLSGTNIIEAQRKLEEGSFSKELIALGQAVDSNIVLTAADPLVQTNETTKQSFKRAGIASIEGTGLEDEVSANFDEVYALIDAQKNIITKKGLVQERASTGLDTDVIIASQLRQMLPAMKQVLFSNTLAKNSSWFTPVNISTEEKEVVDSIMIRLENRAASDDGIANFLGSVTSYLQGLRIEDSTLTPDDVLRNINHVLNKMVMAATQRYNATHKQMGFDMHPAEIKRTITPEIIQVIRNIFSINTGTRGTIGEPARIQANQAAGISTVPDAARVLFNSLTRSEGTGTVRE